jgi:hypothetical protein
LQQVCNRCYVETIEGLDETKANCCFSVWRNCWMPDLLLAWGKILLHETGPNGRSYQPDYWHSLGLGLQRMGEMGQVQTAAAAVLSTAQPGQ